jgi:type IV pilus assembly protein PilV
MRHLRHSSFERSRGFTMLEVLISILILSFGLLGIAGIYIAGVQNNKSASLRTIATQQTYDMADRMRANLAGLTVPLPAMPYYHLPTETQDNDCYTTSNCTAQEMANNDYYEWNNANSPNSNRRLLPNGFGIVCLDSTPNDDPPAGTWNGTAVNHGCDGLGTVYAIKVWWLDDRRAAGFDPSNAASYLRVVTTLMPQP